MSVIGELFKSSIVVGTLYTLAGPNLAALATLSGTDIINHRDDDSEDGDGRKKKKQNFTTFLLGIRWGIGNSIGILLVGGMLMSLQTNPSGDFLWMDYWLRTMFQAFVGVFLLVLGTYGLVKAFKNREYSMLSLDLEFKKASSIFSAEDTSVAMESAITEVACNRKLDDSMYEDGDELSSDTSSSSSGAIERKIRVISPKQKRVMQRRVSWEDDSVVNQMVLCLKSSDIRSSNVNVDETLGLSEFDQKMWSAAKTLTDSMKDYADEENWSLKSESVGGGRRASFTHDSSLRSIDLQVSEMKDVPIPTKGDDAKVTLTKKPSQLQNIIQRRNSLLKSLSKYGNCFVCMPGVLAFLAGVIHGLSSGPPEVLGVIPAVQLKRAHFAVLYLCMFCVVSTLVMGGFAVLYRSVCRWLVAREGPKDEDSSLSRVFLIELGSASLSIVVGIIWLTLLAVGQLDVMAP